MKIQPSFQNWAPKQNWPLKLTSKLSRARAFFKHELIPENPIWPPKPIWPLFKKRPSGAFPALVLTQPNAPNCPINRLLFSLQCLHSAPNALAHSLTLPPPLWPFPPSLVPDFCQRWDAEGWSAPSPTCAVKAAISFPRSPAMQPAGARPNKVHSLGKDDRVVCSLQSKKLLRQLIQWRNSKNRALKPLMNPVFRDSMRFPVASDAAISAQNIWPKR